MTIRNRMYFVHIWQRSIGIADYLTLHTFLQKSIAHFIHGLDSQSDCLGILGMTIINAVIVGHADVIGVGQCLIMSAA